MFKKIAVIGLSCLFPDAKNPEEFFENLLNYKESTRFATEKQMGVDPKVFFHPSKGKPDKYYNTRGGYIDDFSFDPTGYDLPPETLDNLDDLYKWSLYVSREALNDSGYLNHQSALKECGVVLGNLSFPTKSSNQIYIPFYHKPLEEVLQKLLNNNKISLVDDEKLDNISTSNSRISGFPSSLISQALSLSGTHLSLDAACASSLYSVKIACDYISSGRAKMMLAGAVSAADPFFVSMGFSTFQAYPQNSDSSPLDQSSKGLFAGEGAGMFVLKELSEAVKDKDKIYAVISGVGLSNDGRGKFVLSPKKEGQQKAYERAYQNSEIKPDEIKYIECHATGTPLGDVTELESLDQFFGQYHKQMYVGSVKSNFGHLLTAAGMASMLKVILSMNKGIIPATIKIENPLQSPNAVVSKDSVVSKNHPWPSGIKKVAGVNAFGFGGTNAHLIFEEINSATSALKTKIKPHENAQLSIIGMDAIFGKINGLKAFNSLIYSGDDCLIPLPKNRWSGIATKNAFSLAEGFGIDLDHLPEGGYIEHFDFDYLRFRIPPNPADPLIPQQLLMLKAADNAIRDAGLSAGGNVGVIIAMETEVNLHQFRGRVELDYKIKEALEAQGLSLSDQELSDLEVMAKDALLNPVGVNQYTSFIGNIMACRVSSLWDFSGPAYTVSSDESSVFKAIETAMMMLESGEVEAVIVGAVDLSGSPEEVFIKSVITPKAGNEAKVMGFEKGSKGWTVGEGAGAIVLKRTDLAIKDQDRIYANIDALGSGYLESKESRGKTAQKALKIADISPESVSMIEVEASGDLWKAKSEIESLKTAYDLKSHQKIALGSHKANIGHCFAASGIASVIKTALCVYHRYIPANPGWNEPKEELEIELTSFYFPYESKSWLLESHQKKRIAAVNNIAQDGTLSHLILSESTKPQPRSLEIINELPFYFLPFSSETSEELITILANSLKLIENTDELKSLVVDLRRKTLAKPQQSYSIAILGHDKKELSEEIKSAILAVPKAIHSKSEWMTPLGSYFTGNPLGQKGKMVFVYPGGFNSYIGMQKDLLVLFPELMDFIPSYTNNPHLTFRDGLINPKTVKKTENSDIKRFQNSLIENALAMFETGINSSILYTALIKGLLEVKPDSALGYSMGEVSMMFSLGVWDSTDSMSQYLHDQPVFKKRLGGPMNAARDAWGLSKVKGNDYQTIWSCYSVRASQDEIKPYLKPFHDLFLIIINSPNEVVIAGRIESGDKFIKSIPFEYYPVPMSDVMHCEIVKSEYKELVELHTSPVNQVKGIDFYSAVAYKPTKISKEIIADNIAKIYCKQVDFPKLVNQAYTDRNRIFLELGPRSSCTKWIHEILSGKEYLALGIDQKGVDDFTSILRTVAKLYSHRVKLNLEWLNPSNELGNTGTKSLIQKISLGNIPYEDSLLTRDNLSRFSSSVHHGPMSLNNKTFADSKTSQPGISLAQKPYNEQKTSSKPIVISDFNADMDFGNHSFYDQIRVMYQQRSSVSRSHLTFLKARDFSMKQFAESVLLQKSLFGYLSGETSVFNHQLHSKIFKAASSEPFPLNKEPFKRIPFLNSYPIKEPGEMTGPKKEGVIWDERDLLEFAKGSIQKIFGPDFKKIDSYTPRVRLPMPPYLLVNRVTELRAEKMILKPSSITTEYDIPINAWYCIDGQIPWAIAVEAGQCDLLLISYLGIDSQCMGKRFYRLLDCTLTFLDDMPKEGDILRYEIKIKSFAKHGGTQLFFFSYECFVKDKLVFTMTNGCAGFFTQEELDLGKGVILSEKEKQERKLIVKSSFEPLIKNNKTTFNHDELLCITRGRIADCFGPAYDQGGRNSSLRFAAEEMLMLDRIDRLDTRGGLWGLGLVEASKDMAPDHWYFPCHFKDDNVLAGSLMAEGCVQLLQFYMIYLGLQTNVQDARFQPIHNLPNVVRCRGQALPQHSRLVYRMEVTQIGLSPRPFAKANVDIILDGRVVVDFKDVGVEIIEKSRGALSELEIEVEPALNTRTLDFTDQDVIDFATGSLERCFGSEFRIFEKRITQRNPNGELQLISRVPNVTGNRLDFKSPSNLTSEYDVPESAWFYRFNSYPVMPYAVIMEIALQPCGFLGAYMGSCLLYPDQDLGFRNLDGEGTLIKQIDLRGKTITAKINMLSCSSIANTIIQKYDFKLICDNNIFYEGKTTFGYFTPQAFQKQLGLDRGVKIKPWIHENEIESNNIESLNFQSELDRNSYFNPPSDKRHYFIGSGYMNFLDRLWIVKDGGKFQKGYIYSEKDIDPNDWFFPYHFYKDPVMPGSLGVEAILESMRVFAINQGIGKEFKSPYFAPTDSTTKWKYSGQIIPENKIMSLEVHIKNVQYQSGIIILTADASLWKDHLRIYEVTDASISIIES